MDLNDLRAVQREARTSETLQHLPASFYRDVGTYLDELEAERDRAATEADDPWESPDVRRLTDEITAARGVVRGVFERRVGKIVTHASIRANDAAMTEERLTPEEQTLHAAVRDAIGDAQNAALDGILPGDESSPDVD